MTVRTPASDHAPHFQLMTVDTACESYSFGYYWSTAESIVDFFLVGNHPIEVFFELLDLLGHLFIVLCEVPVEINLSLILLLMRSLFCFTF